MKALLILAALSGPALAEGALCARPLPPLPVAGTAAMPAARVEAICGCVWRNMTPGARARGEALRTGRAAAEGAMTEDAFQDQYAAIAVQCVAVTEGE